MVSKNHVTTILFVEHKVIQGQIGMYRSICVCILNDKTKQSYVRKVAKS